MHNKHPSSQLRGAQAARLLPSEARRRTVRNVFPAGRRELQASGLLCTPVQTLRAVCVWRSRSSRLRSPAIFIALVWLFFGGLFSAQAKDSQLWGALLLGTNQATKETPPAELLPYQKRLSKVFGYNAFQVLGKSTRSFSDDSEQWLIPGKTFSVRSIVQPTNDANFKVDLQLFQNKKELVQTVAKLGPDSPLFIRGPLYGQGQLIIVIMVREDN